MHHFQVKRSRSHGSFLVLVLSTPWPHPYLSESLHMWHIYNTWGDDVSHTIFRMKGQRSRSHGSFKIFTLSPPWLSPYCLLEWIIYVGIWWLRHATAIRSLDLHVQFDSACLFCWEAHSACPSIVSVGWSFRREFGCNHVSPGTLLICFLCICWPPTTAWHSQSHITYLLPVYLLATNHSMTQSESHYLSASCVSAGHQPQHDTVRVTLLICFLCICWPPTTAWHCQSHGISTEWWSIAYQYIEYFWNNVFQNHHLDELIVRYLDLSLALLIFLLLLYFWIN